MTFFRFAIYIAMILLLITLCFNVVSMFNAFGVVDPDGGVGISGTDTYLSSVSDLSTPNMGYIWSVFIGAGIVVGVGIGAITHSIAPVGISIFGSVFWASYVNTHMILSIGGYVPSELLTIFTICTGFIFVAALIGMTTGSG